MLKNSGQVQRFYSSFCDIERKVGWLLIHRTHYSKLEKILTFQQSRLYNYGFCTSSISVSRLLSILQRINVHLILIFIWPHILILWVIICHTIFSADISLPFFLNIKGERSMAMMMMIMMKSRRNKTLTSSTAILELVFGTKNCIKHDCLLLLTVILWLRWYFHFVEETYESQNSYPSWHGW